MLPRKVKQLTFTKVGSHGNPSLSEASGSAQSEAKKSNSHNSSLCSSCPALEAEIERLKAESDNHKSHRVQNLKDALSWKSRAEQAESKVAALEQQIGEVYALARGPIEQARAIPLGQWVKTRFVHIEDFNEQILSREDREKALGAAVAVNLAHVRENHESEKYLTEARRLLKLEDGQ